MYERILSFARWTGARGFTADELAAHWNCDHNHVAPRVSELHKKHKRLIATTRTRRTRTGSPARVYVVPEFA